MRSRNLKNALKRPTEVISLDLSYKKDLEELPSDIGQLINLEVLKLNATGVRVLPAELANLSRLRRLELAYTPFSEFPEVVCGLDALQELIFTTANEEVSEFRIPTSIGRLRNLRKLTLIGPFANLPQEIGHLTELVELFLRDTHIAELPATAGELKKLRELTLSCSRLTHLPEEIATLPRLWHLDVAHNRLTSLPMSLVQNPEPDIDCRGNPLPAAHVEALREAAGSELRVYFDDLDG